MGTFIANLHPLLVHLPIGFILISLLVDWHQKNNNSVSRDKLSTFMWGISTLSAVLAMSTGIAALRTGYYEGANMFIHLICGYAIAIVCALIWFLKWKGKSLFSHQFKVFKTLLGVGLVVGGHYGGNLTHGEEHMPLPFDPKSDLTPIDLSDRDSVNVYSDIVKVIFDQKCNRCHEDNDARGRLNMTTQEGLLSDKYGDPAIAPNDIKNSEIYKRISLSTWHHRYMPPSGPPITYKEKKVIEWWIMQGAPFDGNLSNMDIDKQMKTFFADEYGIDLTKKSYFEKARIDPLAADLFGKIKEQNFNITPLAATNNFLDISNHGQSKNISEERMNSLAAAKDHITWLNLSDTELDDNDLKTIGEFKNLTKLNINNTSVSDAGIDHILNLDQLMTLNLYGTNITDESLEKLSQLKKLTSLYLWQTKTTPEGVEKLKGALPNCEIVTGI